MAVRPRLDAQLLLLGALARRVAEGLIAAGEVLRRPMLAHVLIPGRSLEREVRVREMRPRERNEIGLAGHDLRQASHTSNGKRMRFSIEPPYWSLRRLVSGEIKLASR